MRVSLTARYVSHPSIDFGRRRAADSRPRLGLGRSVIVYHLPRAARRRAPSVDVLRSHTSGFSFPTVGRSGRVLTRRAPLSLGTTRARRG
jgi:hypothetical protein